MNAARYVPRRERLADSHNQERWLISYSDFMTLLFGFFVVMYAVSSVNEEKYRVLSDTLIQVFDAPARSTDPIQVGEPQKAASPNVVNASEEPGFEKFEEGDTVMRTAQSTAESELGGFAADDGVTVNSNDHWLEISLDSEVSFAPNDAELSAFARRFLDETAAYLKTFEHPVTVEGYTDNVPVESSRYSNNWVLSAARAGQVAQYLMEQGVKGERISSVGYGENHPVATNATPEGRARNRRVVLVVAHNGNLPRNLNTAPETSAFAFVRHAEDAELEVEAKRKSDGGLIFSNE